MVERRAFPRPASRGPVGVNPLRPAFSGGGIRSFSGPAFRGIPRSFTRMGFPGNRSISGLRMTSRGMSNRGARGIRGTGGTFAARSLRGAGVAGMGLAGAGLAARAHGVGLQHNVGLQHGARWQHRGDWWRNRPFFGWAGPLYWPYFYDDLYYNVFWDYGPYYDDPFWAYGYGDIYGAMFSPYGYGELAGWAPAAAPRVRGGIARGNAPGQPNQPGQPSQWSACAATTRAMSQVCRSTASTPRSRPTTSSARRSMRSP